VVTSPTVRPTQGELPYNRPVPDRPSFSLIIPVLNEEREIPRLLTAAQKVLAERGGEWEILVVDNASTDGTLEAAAPYVDGQRIRALRNDVNRGKGFSIRRGMLEANGELRLMCDADCVDSLVSLAHMEEAAEGGADVVVGSRLGNQAQVTRQQPLRRRFVGLGFIVLSRAAMGPLPRDIYCGFKLWRGDCAQAVFERSRIDGWAFDAEALAMARRMGFTLTEVGIEWRNRPDSRLSIGNVMVPVVRELWEARRSVRRSAADYRAEQRQLWAARTGAVS
jgi:dolichyl-phosphate beta-glucosyltransferase